MRHIEWVHGFPTTGPGFYWFYGYQFSGEKHPKLAVMQVFEIQNGLGYVVNGSFCFESEVGDFYTLRMDEPILPKMAPAPLVPYKKTE
jgi:hypothetical protein